MKFILKPVLAAALFASANAFAALATPTTGAPTNGNGELFLTIFDSAAQVSFTLDLGVGLKEFRTAGDLVRPTGTAADGVTVATGASLVGYDRTFAIDEAGAQFTSFFQASSNSANWRWFITTGDNFGSNTALNAKSLVTTVTTGQTPVAMSNNAFQSALVSIGNTITNTVIAKGDAANTNVSFASNGSVFGSSGNGLYAMKSTTYVRNNGGSFFSFTSDNGVSDSAAFYYFGKSSSDLLAPAVMDQFNNSVNPGLFKIVESNGDFSLQYSVTAVPEASTYALMLAGLGAMGLLISRRRA